MERGKNTKLTGQEDVICIVLSLAGRINGVDFITDTVGDCRRGLSCMWKETSLSDFLFKRLFLEVCGGLLKGIRSRKRGVRETS